MLKLSPPAKFGKAQLDKELAALNLPGYSGLARLSRLTDDEGHLILGAFSKPQTVEPYILVKCRTLSASQEEAVRVTVARHTPTPPPVPASKAVRQRKMVEALSPSGDRVEAGFIILAAVLDAFDGDRSQIDPIIAQLKQLRQEYPD